MYGMYAYAYRILYLLGSVPWTKAAVLNLALTSTTSTSVSCLFLRHWLCLEHWLVFGHWLYLGPSSVVYFQIYLNICWLWADHTTMNSDSVKDYVTFFTLKAHPLNIQSVAIVVNLNIHVHASTKRQSELLHLPWMFGKIQMYQKMKTYHLKSGG